MQSLTCIVCPVGCTLETSGSYENLTVTGNRCPRGISYAQEEIVSPKRTVTATCGAVRSVGRIPVKSTRPCPREKIPSLLHDIYKLKIPLPVKTGDIVIANWNNEGFDIVVTRTLN